MICLGGVIHQNMPEKNGKSSYNAALCYIFVISPYILISIFGFPGAYNGRLGAYFDSAPPFCRPCHFCPTNSVPHSEERGGANFLSGPPGGTSTSSSGRALPLAPHSSKRRKRACPQGYRGKAPPGGAGVLSLTPHSHIS